MGDGRFVFGVEHRRAAGVRPRCLERGQSRYAPLRTEGGAVAAAVRHMPITIVEPEDLVSRFLCFLWLYSVA